MCDPSYNMNKWTAHNAGNQLRSFFVCFLFHFHFFFGFYSYASLISMINRKIYRRFIKGLLEIIVSPRWLLTYKRTRHLRVCVSVCLKMCVNYCSSTGIYLYSNFSQRPLKNVGRNLFANVAPLHQKIELKNE